MKLNQLLEHNDTGCVFAGPGDAGQIEITSIETDHRKCGPGSLFVCIKGYVTDGHRYAAAAAAAGAVAILAQNREALEEYGFDAGKNGPAVILCPDTRWALSGICAAFYGNPSERLRLIGVTGTKGKTSTTYMIRAVYQAAGARNGTDRNHLQQNWRGRNSIGANDAGGEHSAKAAFPDDREKNRHLYHGGFFPGAASEPGRALPVQHGNFYESVKRSHRRKRACQHGGICRSKIEAFYDV